MNLSFEVNLDQIVNFLTPVTDTSPNVPDLGLTNPPAILESSTAFELMSDRKVLFTTTHISLPTSKSLRKNSHPYEKVNDSKLT